MPRSNVWMDQAFCKGCPSGKKLEDTDLPGHDPGQRERYDLQTRIVIAIFFSNPASGHKVCVLLSFAVRLESNILPIMGIQISDRTNTREQRTFEQFQFFVHDLASTATLKTRKKQCIKHLQRQFAIKRALSEVRKLHISLGWYNCCNCA